MCRRLPTLLAVVAASAVLAVPLTAQSPDVRASWQSLVRAERSFAQLAADSGIRAAFLATFAERSVIFRPGPVDGRTHYASRPEDGASLWWEPEAAGVALTGDLGWTSGPSIYTPKGDSTRHHGTYLSVWQREPGGPWRVVLDDGISYRDAAPRQVLVEPIWLRRKFQGRRMLERERRAARDRLLAMERALGEEALRRGARRALRDRVALNVRLLTDGSAPRTGTEQLPFFLPNEGDSLTWLPTDGDISAFEDLGYTWGTWRTGGATPASGHYVHVWQHEPALGWRLVAMLRRRTAAP